MTVDIINQTIRAMCLEVETQASAAQNWQQMAEEEFLYEAAICIFGSQMVFEMAVATADRLREKKLLQPAPREAYARLLAQGWCDALRKLYPDERVYTFWDYLRNAWGRNAGLRLDHFLLSPAVEKRLWRGGVDKQQRGEPHASDHAPAWIELHAR